MLKELQHAKGTITTMSCDPATNGFQVSGNYGSSYVLGQDGGELTQLGANGTWQRTNVFAGGRQLATYDGNGLHFQITDPLGTRRMQTSDVGQPETDMQSRGPHGQVFVRGVESLPFGDGLAAYPDQYAPATADDATPLHFTGKERDPETGEANGNDYFGARYYQSSTGRFLIPDWSAKVEPVPYAKLDDPQSLNLYAYVRDNPLGIVDPDGHCAANEIGCQYNENWEAQHGEMTDTSKAAIANSVLTGDQKKSFTNSVMNAAGKYSLNPNLLVGLADKESGIDPSALSLDLKARGIYQIRPSRQKDLGMSDADVTSVNNVVAPVAKYLSHSYSVLNDDMDLTIGSWRQGLSGIQRINKQGPNAVWDYVIEPARTTGRNQHPARTLGDDYIDYVDKFF